MFTSSDLRQIKDHGVSMHSIEDQINNFKKGFPFVKLHQAAVPGKGIYLTSKEEMEQYVATYREGSKQHSVIKFTPASGAASRMFKNLFTYLEWSEHHDPLKEDFIEEPGNQSVRYFLDHLGKTAFFEALREAMAKDGLSLEECLTKGNEAEIIRYVIEPQGLNYGNLPKGLILFHRYGEGPRTSIEEHLAEGVRYARDAQELVHLHFTLSPEHVGRFEEHLNAIRERHESGWGVRFDITHSIQKPSTDTIAVDLNNEPFREEDGRLVFRPGGHGALIENLNDLEQEIIFIKNIDNVVPDHLREDTVLYKEILGGMLIRLQKEVFHSLRLLESNVSASTISDMVLWAQQKIGLDLPPDFERISISEQKAVLYSKLNRPIRVCGMVKNEGEPGGGPFWLESADQGISLQIVESSQVDLQDPEQKKIFSSATHFNPVDLVCGVYDYRGKKFNLKDFVDPNTGFITQKSKDGRPLKAQELPGLWNGAMAGWITVFVEVPLTTFNPVKTVNDLLRPAHQ